MTPWNGSGQFTWSTLRQASRARVDDRGDLTTSGDGDEVSGNRSLSGTDEERQWVARLRWPSAGRRSRGPQALSTNRVRSGAPHRSRQSAPAAPDRLPAPVRRRTAASHQPALRPSSPQVVGNAHCPSIARTWWAFTPRGCGVAGAAAHTLVGQVVVQSWMSGRRITTGQAQALLGG